MSEYIIYTGEKVSTVSLWERDGDEEIPIYANTRGQCEWYSTDVNEYENTTPNKISDSLIEWLAELYRRIEGDDAENSKPNHMLPDLKWYEAEIIDSIGNPAYTEEQANLLQWAHNEATTD